MGCVESSLETDLQTNIFHVVNVNERGQRQRSARLEVTDSHLLLHQRGRTRICWPLVCLRRYGFDAEQFSFESGRRSPSGPGIYNFKCRRAEALFNILQLQILNIAEEAAARDLAASLAATAADTARELSRTDSRASASAIDYQGYLEPFARTRTRAFSGVIAVPISSSPLTVTSGANGGIGSFVSSVRSPASPAPLSPPAVPIFNNLESNDAPRGEDRDEPPHTPGVDVRETHSTPMETSRNLVMNYIDKTVSFLNQSERPSSYSSSGSERQGDRPISSLKLDSAKQTLDSNAEFNKVEDLMRCRHQDLPVYMNVDTDIIRRDRDHVYANLPVVPPRPSGGSGSSHSGTTTTTTTDTEQPINYIQVDLDRGSDCSQQAVPQSPLIPTGTAVPEFPRAVVAHNTAVTSTRAGYATIDFDKTEALSSTAKAAALWKTGGGTDGSRRTRHNSTFSAIAPVGRHNSALSE